MQILLSVKCDMKVNGASCTKCFNTFLVDSDLEECTCPHCGTKQNTLSVMGNYVLELQKMLSSDEFVNSFDSNDANEAVNEFITAVGQFNELVLMVKEEIKSIYGDHFIEDIVDEADIFVSREIVQQRVDTSLKQIDEVVDKNYMDLVNTFSVTEITDQDEVVGHFYNVIEKLDLDLLNIIEQNFRDIINEKCGIDEETIENAKDEMIMEINEFLSDMLDSFFESDDIENDEDDYASHDSIGMLNKTFYTLDAWPQD